MYIRGGEEATKHYAYAAYVSDISDLFVFFGCKITTLAGAMNDTANPPKPSKSTIVIWVLITLVAASMLSSLIRINNPGCIIDRHSRVEMEMQSISAAINQYRTTYGDIPSGDIQELFRALCGQNPQNLVFLEGSKDRLSPKGDFLDPWGIPYKLYLSGDEVLIRSAGPNKRFDTPGDKNCDDFFR